MVDKEFVSAMCNRAELENMLFEAVRQSGKKIVVLDDDPTGVQTVHGVNVLTSWEEDMLLREFQDSRPLFFILTNTRGVQAQDAADINRSIAETIIRVSAITGRDFSVISRSDSTLRGHYPLEIDILAETLGRIGRIDGHCIIPAFFEAGRHTKDDTHFLLENGVDVPVHLSEFAHDPVFGFSHSHLPSWVEEKTGGTILAREVLCISLNDLRQGGPELVCKRLMDVGGGTPIVVNAEDYADLICFTLGLIQAEDKGKNFLHRTAASFAKVRGAVPDKPLLGTGDMINEDAAAHGGIILIGSHVNKTTEQLNVLLSRFPDLDKYEFDVAKLLESRTRQTEIARVTDGLNVSIAAGRHAVAYSSRKLITANGDAGNIGISQAVSAAFVETVRGLREKPGFIIAKGGITSSDIATKGLNIKVAEVLGQTAKGIPVWKCGPESKFPDMSYIVFPGNVGSPQTLADIFAICTAAD